MMALICLRRGLRLVIENPFTKPHYLTDFWCLKPAIIDRDRRNDGDSMKKPTQYWFIGFKPKNNLIMEPIDFVPNQTLTNINGERRYEKRSEIHPQYANRFIRKFLIDEKGGNHVISWLAHAAELHKLLYVQPESERLHDLLSSAGWPIRQAPALVPDKRGNWRWKGRCNTGWWWYEVMPWKEQTKQSTTAPVSY